MFSVGPEQLLGDHVAAGLFYHISLPSLLLHATAFTITTCSSRAYWTCTTREKLCQSTCLLQILLHKSMLGGTNMFTQATWRKSGKAPGQPGIILGFSLN